jgi:hypothetical protein
MPIIKARANRVKTVRHTCRLQEPNRDAISPRSAPSSRLSAAHRHGLERAAGQHMQSHGSRACSVRGVRRENGPCTWQRLGDAIRERRWFDWIESPGNQQRRDARGERRMRIRGHGPARPDRAYRAVLVHEVPAEKRLSGPEAKLRSYW